MLTRILLADSGPLRGVRIAALAAAPITVGAVAALLGVTA